MRLTLAAAGALVVASACVPLPYGHELSSRRVAGKADGQTLLADDGAWCRVPEATYARVHVGDDHACVWKRAAGRDGTLSVPGRSQPRAPTALPGPR